MIPFLQLKAQNPLVEILHINMRVVKRMGEYKLQESLYGEKLANTFKNM